VKVAQRVARAVKAWTTQPDAFGRVWSPGDVLVLVRKRGPVFAAAIRALKEAGIPVAGADRLDIGDHIAVMDLVAIGRAALLPQDDLTLAVALKTPLVGLTDDDLTRIAARRYGAETLRDALARHAPTDAAALRGFEALSSWRELARRHGPFGFYAALLGPEGGRRRLVARLGSEAGDAIDAFLCLAHSAQTLGTPSLTTFLARFETAEHEVKRDLAAARDDVRVMTVHGAKGLEAPIVVLIDGCEVLGRDPSLLPLGPGLPVWAPGRTTDSGAIGGARDTLRAKGLEEHNRLLYVAMTRAKDRLVIAPFSGAKRETPMEAWCEMIRDGLVRKAGGLELSEAPYGPVERFRDGTTPETPSRAPEGSAPVPLAIPEWLVTPADPEPEPPPPLRPSGALAAADRPARPADGPFAREARLRGSLVHALLERLPGVERARREAAAHAFVHARAPRLPGERRADIVADALRVLDHPDLADAFAPGSRAEVPIAGRVHLPGLPDAAPVSGQIDRLVVTDDEVLVLDFKTSSRAPDPDAALPRPYVLQLALYRALLAEIYPGRTIRAFLVWTAGPLVREVSADRLDDALALVGAA
jgi:ATP-dependent helicase/nuclease subunit A